uniref:Ovule protein n=1 Tax=Meloidogyne incognita TaxID=6306 RepID=A0A914KUU1_MELIC
MTSNSSMSRFRLNCFSIWTHQNRCHQSKRSITLCNNITLNIAIIIFASPNKSSFSFQNLSNHIIN